MKVWLDDQIHDPDVPERHTPHGWVGVVTPDLAIELLKTGAVTEISLDNDLGLTNVAPPNEGRHVLDWIEEMVACGQLAPFDIRIHSRNSEAVRLMNVIHRRILNIWDRQAKGLR